MSCWQHCTGQTFNDGFEKKKPTTLEIIFCRRKRERKLKRVSHYRFVSLFLPDRGKESNNSNEMVFCSVGGERRRRIKNRLCSFSTVYLFTHI